MNETSDIDEEGTLRPLSEREAMELFADDQHDHVGSHRVPLNRTGFDRAAVEQRLREDVESRPGVAWVRLSDLISSGTGRIAGRGIDFEAELARRLRHPAEVARQAIHNRSSSLPPLDAFGRSRSRVARDSLGRS
ncbi:hypothetical protein ACFC1I_15900 [Microbacterium sp. NPDC056044]|uniref:hypothetical protein n=1 Tax=Microbacterium sp. NPDC056044 TaxID=3345690 RepID=UPI0035D9ED64